MLNDSFANWTDQIAGVLESTTHRLNDLFGDNDPLISYCDSLPQPHHFDKYRYLDIMVAI